MTTVKAINNESHVCDVETPYETDSWFDTDVKECPICAANRDPVTGNPRFNAKAIAAMEEVKAMERGEIQSRTYKPHELKQAIKDLLAD